MIRISVDTRGTMQALRAIRAEQLPFATSLAINRTAVDFQEEQRRGMQRRFTIRRPQFVLRAVKIKPFATKRRLFADVLIEPPGGQARADILAKFEERGVKRPRSGQRLAIPDEVRRGRTGVVVRSMRPRALDFQPIGGKVFRTKSNVMIGKKRTILIRRPGGRGVILQRVGRGVSSRLRVLYTFRPQVPIPGILGFEETAIRTVQRRWASNFEAAYVQAVASRR